MATIGYQIGFQNFASELAAQAAAISDTDNELINIRTQRYAVAVNFAPLPGVIVVAAGASVIVPIPSLPQSWDPTLWSVTPAGVIVADHQLAGRYIASVCLALSDDSGAPTTYSITGVHGRDLSTVPVIATRFTTRAQLANVNEPCGGAVGGQIALPDGEDPGTADDVEFAVQIAHSSASSRNVSVVSLSLLLTRQRDLDQI